MLNELSTHGNEYTSDAGSQESTKKLPLQQQKSQPRIEGLQETINEVMVVNRIDYPEIPQVLVQYSGELTMPSAQAFDYTEPMFKKLDVHAYFTENEQTGSHQITVLKGRYAPKPRHWWPNLVLFILTLLSLLWIGSSIQAASDDRAINALSDIRLWEGWPYAVSMVLILGAHELGHYFAARYHNVSVTLPYFIPMPLTFFGTLGAFIQLREPMRSRNILFDVGIAGPLAGLVFTIPVLFLGLATSEVQITPPDEDILREGNSIFYAASKVIVYGRFLPNEETGEDVLINQFAQAGWTGLFITALNLIPLGQLDGGHVIYTLLGPRAAKLFWPVLGVFVILSTVNSAWILWTILLFFLGRYHARPLEDITPLSNRRRILGYAALVIFVLIFIPNPLEFVEAGS